MHNLALNTDEVQSVPYRVAYSVNNWDLDVDSAVCREVAPGRQYMSTTTSRCWSPTSTPSQTTPISSLRSPSFNLGALVYGRR